MANRTTTVSVTCWATSTARFATARRRARAATPGGNDSEGRSRSPRRAAGPSTVSTIAAAATVAPTDSVRLPAGVRRDRSPAASPFTASNATREATTTRLETSGASAGPMNRRWACSAPYRTTASPKKIMRGAKTTSMSVPAATTCDRSHSLASPLSSETIGPARTAMSRVSGTRTSIVQVSSAEVIRPASSRAAGSSPDREAAEASTGTTIPASAPPATSSKTMLGT
ncbi:hypothetical protein GCM10018953_64590 [Streptosporangium nondiastaticum]